LVLLKLEMTSRLAGEQGRMMSRLWRQVQEQRWEPVLTLVASRLLISGCRLE
jgi:hypothetical protein